jgi:hypothetical protein
MTFADSIGSSRESCQYADEGACMSRLLGESSNSITFSPLQPHYAIQLFLEAKLQLELKALPPWLGVECYEVYRVYRCLSAMMKPFSMSMDEIFVATLYG